eukprot:CAMPEP_0113312176 /NCGR_PEP_ID=MMETSP0010_2-20120614/9109_1 /TAXON_ID=216773 ORGANISM="Corethron hystrix, Strain 308" /NCGR_SAMPLE_ID=MMETSP0010_2 /ASSEMBLY_ACC=CAM_ASM_000155 /LENGTH=33 /DNA_ID=CAMNT_0000167945 /DNA_START=780 /DNA_END=881 /DNA_ORIENTATION=- /assembly_acc=CAM_ASM_000155
MIMVGTNLQDLASDCVGYDTYLSDSLDAVIAIA